MSITVTCRIHLLSLQTQAEVKIVQVLAVARSARKVNIQSNAGAREEQFAGNGIQLEEADIGLWRRYNSMFLIRQGPRRPG